jgi:hypothetical protein
VKEAAKEKAEGLRIKGRAYIAEAGRTTDLNDDAPNDRVYDSEAYMTVRQNNFGEFDWVIDTGCDSNMSCRKEWYINYTPFKQALELRSGGKGLKAHGTGTIELFLQRPNEIQRVTVKDVLYTPTLEQTCFALAS